MRRTFRRSLAALLAAGLLPSLALAQFAFKETHDANVEGTGGDTPADRAGFEYDNRAYPAAHVGYTEHRRAAAAFDSLPGDPVAASWKELGPFTPEVAAPVTYTGRAAKDAGRVTALAISHRCCW